MTRKFKIISIGFLIAFVSVLLVYLLMEKDIDIYSEKALSEEDTSYYKELDSLIEYHPDQAKIAIQKFYNQVKNSQDSVKLAYAYYYKTLLYLKNRKPLEVNDSISFFIEKALLYAENNNSDDFFLKKGSLNYMAGSYYKGEKKFTKSIACLLEAQDYFERSGNKKGKALVFTHLGIIYSDFDEINKATFYLEEAHGLFNELRDSLGIASYYSAIASICLKKGECEEIKEGLRVSVRFLEENNYLTQATYATLMLGDIELKAGNMSSAKAYMDKAYQKAVRSQNVNFQKHILQHYGNWYNAQKDYSEAMAFYKEGFKLPNNLIDVEALQNLSDLYVQTGDYKRGYKYLNQYYQLTDSLTGAKVKTQIDEIRWRNEIEQQEYQNQLLQSQYETEQQKNKKQLYAYLAIVISALLIIVLMWFLYKNKAKNMRIIQLENNQLEDQVKTKDQLFQLENEKYQLEMEIKSRELSAVSIQLLQKNRVFTELDEIINERGSDFEKQVKELRGLVRKNRNQEKDWEQFQEVFQKIHPRFFDTIQQNYPQLSKTEIRVCAYIRINMTNIEISNLLNITYRSLIKSRYRIRVKIGLGTNSNLDEFIQNW